MKTELPMNTPKNIQALLYEGIKKYFPDAEAKKINKDNFLDIYVPSVNPKRGNHLFFNTGKGEIKIGFFCRDEEYNNKIISKNVNLESYSQGIRPRGNPVFKDAQSAVDGANEFLNNMVHEQISSLSQVASVNEMKEDNVQDRKEHDTSGLQGFHKTIFDNGDKYEGEYVDGQLNGKGKYTFLDGNVYEGEWINSKMTGKGIFSFSDGGIYEGDLIDGAFHGKGKLLQPDGSIYEGDFENDMKTGKGKWLFPDGSIYEGDFLDGNFSGNGVLRNSNGEIVHDGIFFDGQPVLQNYDCNIDFELKSEIVDLLCTKIKDQRLLPFLPYIDAALENDGFVIDNHKCHFFSSNVYITDKELKGFLYVNMDGFYSNCIEPNKLSEIFSWEGISEIKLKTDSKTGLTIGLFRPNGQFLTIRQEGGNSLMIIYSLFYNVWKFINEEFENEPAISWSKVDNMGILRKSFNSQLDYENFIRFSKK